MSRRSSYSPPLEDSDYTKLQIAALEGCLVEVRYLVEEGVELDVGSEPALHLSLRKKYTSIALYLLQAGADFELKDAHGDYPIHIACALGLLEVVQTLCALGCSVEVTTTGGLYPLHLAARNGHIHVVRCLCTAGCNIEVKNSDNIRADITALKYGHNDIADLLDKLRATGQRDVFARQLVPTSKPALRISLRILGHCGVGKTSLVKSLNAGLFSSLFRRSSSLQSNKSRPSSPINSQIEMGITSRQNSLTFESPCNYQSTNGINMQNVEISNVGDVSVWDFSGQENFFPTYHHFLWPSPYTLTAILFNLEDSPAIQVQQVCFWLNFILARQPADIPTTEYGKIILIATHVDTTRALKNQHGEWISTDAQKTVETLRKMIPHAPNLIVNPIVMDCNVPASHAFKQLKSILTSIKQDCIQGVYVKSCVRKGNSYDLITSKTKQTIGTWTGLLESTLNYLTTLQKDHEQFPVLTRPVFSEYLRLHVNILASDDHIHELLQQLHAMGEVFCVNDLVVLNVSWLGTQLIGELLSNQFILHARVTGVYTAEDFQASYNQCDAIGVLELLRSLELCIECDVDGDVEYEFPIYNHIETLSGLWDPGDPRYRTTGACYGGLRLYTPPETCHLFSSMFPYIQIELRRSTLNSSFGDVDIDLYQWYHGSKLCTTTLETLITLNEDVRGVEYVEIKIRGPRQSSKFSFAFFDQTLKIIAEAISTICPGLLYEKHVLSSHQLRVHHSEPYCYNPQTIISAILDSDSIPDVTVFNPDIEKAESMAQLVLFGDADIANSIQWGCGLKIYDLPPPTKLKLCGLLDPPDPHGRDWCLLALKVGLSQERIAALDSQHTSHTMRLLTISDCSIGNLITSLIELDRLDASEVVLRSTPIFKVVDLLEV